MPDEDAQWGAPEDMGNAAAAANPASIRRPIGRIGRPVTMMMVIWRGRMTIDGPA
jgi:hypothetical protein